MLYQISLKLHQVINAHFLLPRTETIRVLEKMVCTSRQLNFEIIRNDKSKIGMIMQANKFYHVNKLIGLDKLNMSFVHFKKLMKIQFLKNGKT